jgi:hypothetical protein
MNPCMGDDESRPAYLYVLQRDNGEILVARCPSHPDAVQSWRERVGAEALRLIAVGNPEWVQIPTSSLKREMPSRTDDRRAAEAMRLVAEYLAGDLTFAQMRHSVGLALRDPEHPPRPHAPCSESACAGAAEFGSLCRMHHLGELLRK